MYLHPIDKSLNKSSPHSPTSIMLHNINMKMCRIIFANVLNVTEIRDVVEMIKFRRIFQATREISDCTPDAIKRHKKNYLDVLQHIGQATSLENIVFLPECEKGDLDMKSKLECGACRHSMHSGCERRRSGGRYNLHIHRQPIHLSVRSIYD
jgi:hypothetical protein